jgi:hypothetical protein
MMKNIEFDQVEEIEDMRGAIKNAFEVDLNITGGWGYDNTTAVVADKIEMPLEQFVHMFATIRATVEMNLIIDDENERYGAINVNFQESKKFEINNRVYDVLTFKITAINEKQYADFIQEYKDGYGKKDFDLTDHFKRREESTISRVVDYWFYGLKED